MTAVSHPRFERKRIKHGFRVIGSGTTPTSPTSNFYVGEIPWVTSSELRESVINDTNQKITQEAVDSHPALKLYPTGTLLFAMYGATIGRLGLLGIPAYVNQAVCALAEPKHFIARFAFYALQASKQELIGLASGGGQPNLNAEKLREHFLPRPELAHQQAIADYLDRETARLDALIAAKERWLELLAEKRRALITHAVTRGLNPAAPLRDSGHPWLGETPTHWDIWKIGHFAEVGNGSTPNRECVEYWNGGAIPWLNSAVVNLPEVHHAEEFVTQMAFEECHLPLVNAGSLLVGITGQGKTRGSAVVLSFVATINQHLAFISPKKESTDIWYLRWLFFAAYDFLRAISDEAGGTKGALTCQELAELRIPLPPFEEQRAIVAHISAETKKLDALRAATERTISLLQERRAALITAAVTGKIEIPGSDRISSASSATRP